jgi:GABA permease
MMKWLVVANDSIDSQEVCEAIAQRASAGPVEVTLVASASVGAGPLCVPRTEYGERLVREHRRAIAERMERAMRRLRDAGVAVAGILSEEPDATVCVEDLWDPSRFDEIVVSCRPWLSCRRAVSETGPA